MSAHHGRMVLVGIAAAITSSASAAPPQWPEQFNKLPAAPNAVVLIQVDKLRQLADQLGDNGKDAQQAARDIQADLTESVRQIALVASIDLNHLESNWELALCDMARIPSNDQLARIEQGYVDRVEDRTVIWSPRNVYFLPLPNSMLGLIQPADRQMLGRWARTWQGRSEPLPDYLQKALEIAAEDVPIVMAMDMSGAISAIPAAAKLRDFPPVADSGINVDELADLLSHLQGVTFAVQVRDGLYGRVRVDFDRPAGLLEQQGKAIFLEILSRAHAAIPDIAQWAPRVAGNSFSMQGPISVTGIQQLISLLRSPSTVGSMSNAAGAAQVSSPGQDPSLNTQQAEANLRAESSKRYFQSVVRCIDQIRDLSAKSMGERAMWDDRIARKIDQLPILNVDPELIDYGANVASLLRGAGVTIRNTNLDAGVQKIGTRTSGYTGGGVANPYTGNTGFVNLYSPNYTSGRITQEARQKGMSEHIKNMQQIDTITAEVRRDMTQRYQTEF